MFMTRSFNVTPKTTEQHLIARNDKSVACVTNNKRLLDVCTIEANYWETRSIAQPLCDSRASCMPLSSTMQCCTTSTSLCLSQNNGMLIVIAYEGCWEEMLSGDAMSLSQYRCWKFWAPHRPRLAPAVVRLEKNSHNHRIEYGRHELLAIIDPLWKFHDDGCDCFDFGPNWGEKN